MSTNSIRAVLLGSQGKGFYETQDIYHFPCQCGWGHVCSKGFLKKLLKKSELPENEDPKNLVATGCVACSSDADIKLQIQKTGDE